MSWFWPKKEVEETPETPDEIEYASGFACKNGHAHCYNGEVPTSGTRVCPRCGEISVPCVAKAIWKHNPSNRYHQKWVDSLEFVRYLDEDSSVTVSDEILTKLKVRAARDMTRHIATEDLTTYTYGLQDGETMTALWLLGEIQKETK
jgi:hypothetical protein